MDTTRVSLLIRIRDPDDSVSWREFYQLYAPVIYQFARCRGLGHDDAEEIRSSCYESIIKHIRQFEYSTEKAGFKAWLRRIVLNRVIDLKRKRADRQFQSGELGQIPASGKTPDEAFDEQWKLGHLQFCLERIKPRLPDQTWQAFELLAKDISVAEVCEQLGLNDNQVYKAKSRVLKLVRDELRLVYAEDGP